MNSNSAHRSGTQTLRSWCKPKQKYILKKSILIISSINIRQNNFILVAVVVVMKLGGSRLCGDFCWLVGCLVGSWLVSRFMKFHRIHRQNQNEKIKQNKTIEYKCLDGRQRRQQWNLTDVSKSEYIVSYCDRSNKQTGLITTLLIGTLSSLSCYRYIDRLVQWDTQIFYGR